MVHTYVHVITCWNGNRNQTHTSKHKNFRPHRTPDNSKCFVSGNHSVRPFFCYGVNDAHPAIDILPTTLCSDGSAHQKQMFIPVKKTLQNHQKKNNQKNIPQETPHYEEMAGKFLGAHFAKVSSLKDVGKNLHNRISIDAALQRWIR